GSPNAGTCAGDDGFLPLQKFPVFGLRQNWFRQIHETRRMRHFRYGTSGCLGWHKRFDCWFCGFVAIQCDSLQIAFWTAPGPRQPQRSFPLLTNLNFCYFSLYQMARSKHSNLSKNNSANIGFEAKLCIAADKLRINMDDAE